MQLTHIQIAFLQKNRDLFEKEDWNTLFQRALFNAQPINLPSILTSIGVDVLKDYHICPNYYMANTKLPSQELAIPEGVSAVGDYAFYETKLEKISLPESLLAIGEGAFRSTLLGEITIPAKVATIGQYAFAGCSDLTTVHFAKNSNLSEIKTQTFYRSGLETIYLPEGIQVLRYSAFANCLYLRQVGLPKSLKTIKSMTFYACPLLDQIRYTGTCEDFKKIDLQYSWILYQDRSLDVICTDGRLVVLAGEVVG